MSELPLSSTLDGVLIEIWQDVLGVRVGVDDNFFMLGGNSVQAAMIMNRLQDKMRAVFHPAIMFDAPTITLLGKYLRKNYPHLYGYAGERVSTASSDHLTAEDIARAREHFRCREASDNLRMDDSGKKNGPAIFILSPPRSGSTLLRVILGGHPRIFSPPELYLLSFNTLKERRDKLSGRLEFFREGLIRAVMQLRGVSKEVAEGLLKTLEDQGTSTHAFFRTMQDWADGKRIIDKTPGYALNPNALRRADAEFDGALFIHLARHPMATIASFEDVRVDLVTGDERDPLPDSAKKRGELWWLISHEHILSFLQTIPKTRQIRVRYEDLVNDPDLVVRSLCDKLNIEFSPDMLEPYADKKNRMTDGVSDVSRMLGDQKFHFYERIEASRSDDWRSRIDGDFLCDRSWAVAEALGYVREKPEEEEREQWEI
jgi:hypothetical protein